MEKVVLQAIRLALQVGNSTSKVGMYGQTRTMPPRMYCARAKLRALVKWPTLDYLWFGQLFATEGPVRRSTWQATGLTWMKRNHHGVYKIASGKVDAHDEGEQLNGEDRRRYWTARDMEEYRAATARAEKKDCTRELWQQCDLDRTVSDCSHCTDAYRMKVGYNMAIHMRVGAFMTGRRLASWDRPAIPEEYKNKCVLCGAPTGETVAHLLVACQGPREARAAHTGFGQAREAWRQVATPIIVKARRLDPNISDERIAAVLLGGRVKGQLAGQEVLCAFTTVKRAWKNATRDDVPFHFASTWLAKLIGVLSAMHPIRQGRLHRAQREVAAALEKRLAPSVY